MKTTAKTIDKYCGKPKGSFAEFIKFKEEFHKKGGCKQQINGRKITFQEALALLS